MPASFRLNVTNSKLISGKGLLITNITRDGSPGFIKRGEKVYNLIGKIYNKPTRETIHIGENQHIYDFRGIFMNHSFDPTTRIDERNVVAAKDIFDGDELTFNYNKTEINMACPFDVSGVNVSGLSTNTD